MLTVTLIVNLGTVVLFAPVFIIPVVVVAGIGGFLGSVYMRAQLSIKREMSNAKAPVLGAFGSAMAGLSKPSSNCYKRVPVLMSTDSLDQGIRSAGFVQTYAPRTY